MAREIPAATQAGFDAFWSSEARGALTRVALLKAIEGGTALAFEVEHLNAIEDESLKNNVRAVVLESNMAGIEEFGETWFACIRQKMLRMAMCADWIVLAMAQGDASGFDAFERALIRGASGMLPAYNDYYLAYLAAVQDPKAAAALKATPPPASRADLYNSYTVTLVDAASEGGFKAVPFATYFAATLAPVIANFDAWIAECTAAAEGLGDAVSGVWDAGARASYVAFLTHYRMCSSLEAAPEALEAAWEELDRKWMDAKMPIQLVHDIETGYGDPLRVKATPDMSLRFIDEMYSAENAAIVDIQQRMMAFYSGRDTDIARGGLTALSNTLAGIYFIPFKTGISLQFSFSGQSIPNRENVKVEKGVKIYFDAVETAARVEINKVLVAKCFHEASGAGGVLTLYPPDAVEQLVWHVAAHEVGHAIYNLNAVADCFSNPAFESLLEEPRAELTAMFTLKLLFDQQVLDRPHLDKALAHFALDGLRYFDKYESEALRPYIIFMVYAFKVYGRRGFLSFDPTSGKVVLDPSKTLDVLGDFCDVFLRILGCMDARDGPGLEAILWEEMAPEDAFVRAVLKLLKGGAPHVTRPDRGCSCHPSWSIPKCGVCVAPSPPAAPAEE